MTTTTAAEFEAAYLAARIEVEKSATGETERNAAKVLNAAARKGFYLNAFQIETHAQQVVHFPAHIGHTMSYTRNAMHCLDCDCLATEGR